MTPRIPGLEDAPAVDDPSKPGTPSGSKRKQIEVFFVPWDLHVSPAYRMDNGFGFQPEASLSLKECVRGKLYDVRYHFERRHGTLFRHDDLCYYSPESHLLIIAAFAENMEQIKSVVREVVRAPVLTFCGELIVKDPKKGEGEQIVYGRWILDLRSGSRGMVSGGDLESGLSQYDWEIEPIISEIGNAVEYNMLVKVRLEQGAPAPTEFKIATSGTLLLGKPLSTLIGTTKDGREICLRVTATLKGPQRPEVLETPEKKQQLIECIRRQLEK